MSLKYFNNKNFIKIYIIYSMGDWGLGIGDWGLGIGDWAQSPFPIPNPQSPIPNPHVKILEILIFSYYLIK